MAKKDKRKLLERIHERYRLMTEADQENRRWAIDDMKFMNVPGEQWELNMKQERGDRPCYEFNKLRITGKRIINDMRISRPAAKVRGVEGGDKELADIQEGLGRNIWNTSDADTVIDYAAEFQVGAGMGAWRINTDYISDLSFDQDIIIEPIFNPLCLYPDNNSKDPMKRDAQDWIYTEMISKASFEAKWPKAEAIDFEDSEFDDELDWRDEESVRIAEYWWKEPTDKEIWQLQDGKIIDPESDEGQAIPPEMVVRTRVVKTNKIMMAIVSGDAVLEGPTEWAGTMFPFVMVFGEYMIIDGKVYWWGLPRFSKDAQRSYNVSRTSVTETIAMAPQAKFWATPEQAKGHTDKWAEAHRKNFPFLLYNADAKVPGPPLRMGGADIPIALIEESRLASEELKAVTGIFSPDLGAGDQAKSGVQERERRAQGQVATFNFQDNMTKGIQRTWELILDLIPKIYDTERELRVLGSDGAEDYQRVNTFVMDETGQPIKINDLSMGRYDVTISTGPNFSTQRQEASEIYMNMANVNPGIFAVAGDLIFKSLDLPYSEDIAERLKAMLPPEIQALIQEDGNQSPEVQQAMQQANQAMQMVEQQMQAVQEMGTQIEQEKMEVDKGKMEIQKLIADLETAEAQFEAQVAKEIAQITQRDAKVQIREVQQEFSEATENLDSDKAQLSEQVSESIAIIGEMAQEFTRQAVEVMNEIQQRKPEKQPRIVRVESKRENGKLVAIPIFEDLTGQADQAKSTDEVLDET